MDYRFVSEYWDSNVSIKYIYIYIIRKYLSIFYHVSVYDTLIDITGDGLMSNLDE